MEKTDSDEFTLARRGSLLSISMLEDPDYYVDIKDITIGPLLGSGAFSVVHSMTTSLNFILSSASDFLKIYLFVHSWAVLW